MSVIYDGTKIKITDRGGSVKYKNADASSGWTFDPESEVGIPSVGRLSDRLTEYENGGGTADVMYDSVSGIFRVVCRRDTGVREEYDVRADLGIVTACRLYRGDGETPYYELTTTALLTSVSYDDDQFKTD